jgi:DnaJ-class molecular chaperone
MKDPYQVLGLSPDASETQLRQRYLELVRAHPPDQSPARFAEVRAAYDHLRDPIVRWSRELFQPSSHDSLEDIIRDVQQRVQGKRIPVDVLLSLGKS